MSFARYKELRAEIDERLVELRQIGQAAFNEEAKGLFEKHPSLKSFSWTQYTPYFNDGEACTFRVYRDYMEMTMHGKDGGEDEEIEEFYTPYQCEKDENGREIRPANSEYSPEQWEAGLDVRNFMRNFDNDSLEEFFGDHAKVTVYKDKIDVDEYSHD